MGSRSSQSAHAEQLLDMCNELVAEIQLSTGQFVFSSWQFDRLAIELGLGDVVVGKGILKIQVLEWMPGGVLHSRHVFVGGCGWTA